MRLRLEVRGVSFSYESTPILEDATFSVEQSEFLGVMGPNGSGKTTLLRCMCRVLEPRVGTILIDGRDLKKFSRGEVAKSVGVVPQSPVVDAAFTVIEIVLMGRTSRIGRFEAESVEDLEAVEEAMKMTDTLHLSDRTFDELSGGERQRVIIARALAQEPEVLLLDEPTVHLDIKYQLEVLELIEKLNKQKGIVIVAVFHDLNLASQHCDRIILLHNGRIEAIGPPDQVLTPESIRRIYGVDAVVKRHPVTNALHVAPYLPLKRGSPNSRATVHLVCGGGSGSVLMKLLPESSMTVTAGVLNVLDTDYETARSLGLSVVGEIPFSMISEESFAANVALIEHSDIVVLTDFPVGPGNLRNLQAVEEALEKGRHVVVIESTPVQQRDFTGGIAAEYMARLRKSALVVRSAEECLQAIINLQAVVKGH
jgi:iron complex transport system ATP-binding protein